MSFDTSPAIIGYKAIGDGPQKVIVMHDWHGDHTTYDPILPYLDGKNFHYIFADLPGYGLSSEYTVPVNIQKIASNVIALVDYLDWPRFHIVGHSLSAMIAQYVAVLAADRVTSLTAICPLPASGSLASDDALRFFASTANDDDAFRRLIGFLSGQLSDGWMDAKRNRSRLSSTSEVKMQYFHLFRTDFSAELSGSNTKVNLILGDHDPGLDEATLAPLFRNWFSNLSLNVIPNCGHYPMEEAPPYFVSILEKLFDKDFRQPFITKLLPLGFVAVQAEGQSSNNSPTFRSGYLSQSGANHKSTKTAAPRGRRVGSR